MICGISRKSQRKGNASALILKPRSVLFKIGV
jgi:hypothetical protein